MKCKTCGRDISPNSKYCPHCHDQKPFDYPKEKEINTNRSRKNSSSMRFILISSAAILLVLAVLIGGAAFLAQRGGFDLSSLSGAINSDDPNIPGIDGVAARNNDTTTSPTQQTAGSTQTAASTTAAPQAEPAQIQTGPQTEEEQFLYQVYQAFESDDIAALAQFDDSEIALSIVDEINRSGVSAFYYIPDSGNTGVGAGIHLMEKSDGSQSGNYGFYYGEYVDGKRSGNGSLFWTKQGDTQFYFKMESRNWDNDTLTGYCKWRNYISVEGNDIEAEFEGPITDGLENGVIRCTFNWGGTKTTVNWTSEMGVRGEPSAWSFDAEINSVFGIRTAYREVGTANTILK